MTIKRKVLPQLLDHLKEKEITMLIGPRQCGKTTLLNILRERVEKENNKTFYLNLDIEQDFQICSSQETLLSALRLELGSGGGVVFIDEIQRKENAGLFLKGIYDIHPEYKFVVSGSGSIELKEKISESLAGRKLVFEIQTLSFEEFLNFKTEYKYEDRLGEYIHVRESSANEYLNEYLNYGGYPKVVLTDTAEMKLRILDEIYQSYLIKDVVDLLGVNKPDKFSQLVRILGSQVGNILNYNELSNTIDVSDETIKRYLWYLEQTYIINLVTPYFRNPRKELVKSPVVYFHDIGLRNYAAGEVGRIQFTGTIGAVFENFIYLLLKNKVRYTSNKIHFWRTIFGAEVDFILDEGSKIIPYEVKYKGFKDATIGKSLRSFIEKYKPEEAYMVGLSLGEEVVIDSTKVSFQPWSELL